jgi:hypothetical protein
VAYALAAADVQDALGVIIADALAAASEDVPSCIGYPVGGPETEHVYVSGQFDADLAQVDSGGYSRDEAAPIDVIVTVTHPEDEMTANRDRAVALALLVDEAIAADPSLGSVVTWSRATALQGRDAINEDGVRQYVVKLTVSYRTTTVNT